MAVIKLTQFGGIAPSVDARNLAPDGAQEAYNLDMRFGDFRPIKGPGLAVTTVATATKSIFRTPSGVWLSSGNDVNYVNAQITDAASERVYLTGRSSYPEAWQSNVYRRLGVPASTTAPAVVLKAVDETTQVEVDVIQAAAVAAVTTVVEGLEVAVLAGNAPPAGVVTDVVLPDPLYNNVRTHIQFTDFPGGTFVDSSPQSMDITNTSGALRGTDNLGPLGTAGAGYGYNLQNGLVVAPGFGTERAEPWTVDMWVTATTTFEQVQVWVRNDVGGILAKVALVNSAGTAQTLWCDANDTTTFATLQLQAARSGGAAAAVANVPVLISLQNTGSRMELYIDGVLAGRTPASGGLRFTLLFRAANTGAQGFTGKADEVRATAGARYSANFAVPTGPFGTLASPNGFWVQHGNGLATGLPTKAAGDAAYLVPMILSGGAYSIIASEDVYLQDPALSGSQVEYDGNIYWAVPVINYQADAKSMNAASLQTALRNLDAPSTPGTKLFTTALADSISAEIAAAYDLKAPPASTFVSALNSRTADVRLSVSAGYAGTQGDDAADALAEKVERVADATTALQDYFDTLSAEVSRILAEQGGSIFGSVIPAAVTRIIETRGYIFTYVTDWDEESAPSPPSDLLELDQNDGVQVTARTPTSGRNIVGWRLYRSSTTNAGAAYQLVEDTKATNAVLATDKSFKYFKISNLVYTDLKKQEELQEQCPSLTWAEPPAGLLGLVGLPNGIMAGFFDKTLCLSEPFTPYAWPVEYQITLEYKIVGIGVFGQTAVVLTEGHPYYASGADSASFSAQKLESPQACIAKRTIAPAEGGVIFASPDGLCLASTSGIRVLTQGAYNKAAWAAVAQADSFGAFHEGVYYLFNP